MQVRILFASDEDKMLIKQISSIGELAAMQLEYGYPLLFNSHGYHNPDTSFLEPSIMVCDK